MQRPQESTVLAENQRARVSTTDTSRAKRRPTLEDWLISFFIGTSHTQLDECSVLRRNN